MKVLAGVFLCFYVASAAVYVQYLDRFLPPTLDVKEFKLPGFVERNYTSEEQAACYAKIGMIVNGTFQGTPSNYDVLEVLKSLGGAPGEVDAPKRNEVPQSPDDNSGRRPLEDPPEEQWLYDYRATDYKYYFRLEHAVKRFPGTDKEFLDVRGRVAWTPEDTCGRLKVAEYVQDDTGFHADVSRDYCFFGGKVFSCATIPYCNSTPDGGQVCLG